MSRPVCDIHDLYAVLSQDLAAIGPRVSGALPGFLGDPAGFIFDPSCAEAAALALAKSIGKKCIDNVSDEAPDRCLMSYLESNESCRTWKLPDPFRPPRTVDKGLLRENPDYPGYEAACGRELLELVKCCFQSALSGPTPDSLMRDMPDFDGEIPWSWDNVFLAGNPGPGTALEASGFSWYEKFYQSPLSYTSFNLYEEYQASLPSKSLRRAAEIQRLLTFGNVEVVGGKYSSVRKNTDTDRSIDIQPSLNMFGQKGLACIINGFVRSHYGVDLALQPIVNRELARRGSLSDKLVTLDLKDASNRIPWSLIRWIADGHPILPLIETLRTERTLMPWDETVENYLVSGMGNGFTFSLMTLLFLAVIEAVHLYNRRPFKRLDWKVDMSIFLADLRSYDGPPNGCNPTYVGTRRISPYRGVSCHLDELLASGSPLAEESVQTAQLPDWGVFGDDIICHVKVSDDVVRVLRLLNAEVNLSKSFFKGPFRESCGGDYFLGQNIRGVYAKSLATAQDRVSLLNRLVAWNARTGINLPKTLTYLWRSVRNDVHLVPLHESDVAGLKVPSDFAPKYPTSQEVSGLSRDLQERIKTYPAAVPIKKVRTFQGAEFQIYGVGILLSMIRGEARSSLSKPLHAADGKKRGRGDYKVKITQRVDETAYESVWLWTACWDKVLFNEPNADLIGKAIGQFLNRT